MQTPIRKKPGKYTHVEKDPYITKKQFDLLTEEFASIKRRRPKVIEETQAHAEMGDFSENVEYQLAKRKLRGMNSAMDRIEKKLNSAIIIPENSPTDYVKIGHTVEILFNDVKKTYTILGSDEADPTKRIISHLSPMGKAMIGKKEGDVFEIEINEKNISCEIIKINKLNFS